MIPARAGGAGGGAAGAGLPAAVLFDMDGLLVDTEHLWTIAERDLAARHGRVFTPELKTAMLGHGIDTAVPIMLTMLGLPDVDLAEASTFLLERAGELFRDPEAIIVQPGALELLAGVGAAGVPTALVSSSFRSLMDPVLGVLALRGAAPFTVTVAGDEVARRKPFPEPYLRAAELLGVVPGDCVVLEDSTTGALAGLRAGCPTILVPSMPGIPSLAEVAGATGLATATETATATEATLATATAATDEATTGAGTARSTDRVTDRVTETASGVAARTTQDGVAGDSDHGGDDSGHGASRAGMRMLTLASLREVTLDLLAEFAAAGRAAARRGAPILPSATH